MEFKILNVETISDELSLDDLKGGLNSMGMDDCSLCNIFVNCPENEKVCGSDSE